MARGKPAVRRPDPTDLDSEIFALTLQLEDITINENSASPTNSTASNLFKAELLTYLTLLEDKKLACLIAWSREDARAIAEIVRAEGQAKDARRLQLGICTSVLESKRAPMITTPTSPSSASSVTAVEDVQPAPEELIQEQRFCCIGCAGHFLISDGVKLEDCPHFYCFVCLKNFFMLATKDLTLFHDGGELKCCNKEISLDLISEHMDETEVEAFLDAEVQVLTPNPVHCANTDCAKFIRPDRIRAGVAQCKHCDTSTCFACKKKQHTGDCPEDKELQATLALAVKEGWQRCYKCNTLVELNTGCNHITCKCKAEFCYVCGKKWRTCRCVQWDEGHLLDRAEQVVNRERLHNRNTQNAGDARTRQQRVAEVQQQLRAGHECTHNVWFEKLTGTGGVDGYLCELCNDHLPEHILRCPHCFMQICESCRNHRLARRNLPRRNVS